MLNDSFYEQAAEMIYTRWDNALERRDIDAILALYADDAVIESPLIAYLLEQPSGICRGKNAIRQLAELDAKRKPSVRKYYKMPFLRAGNLIMWEYPRQTPDGEQMDFVEVMEINDAGLIQVQRIYWGWRGVNILQQGQFHQHATSK